MSLTVVSTPIGDLGDITLRGKKTLEEAEIIICEELKPARVLLKRLEIEEKELFPLNEHSKSVDIKPLVEMCKNKKVALISDCGTPGFFDPGPELVKGCLEVGIKVEVNPGASSLMAFLSLSGERIQKFLFCGFLPAEREERSQALKKLTNTKDPIFIMDTPYRLNSTLKDLVTHNFGTKRAVLGMDLTGPHQEMARGSVQELAAKEWTKLPFILLVIP